MHFAKFRTLTAVATVATVATLAPPVYSQSTEKSAATLQEVQVIGTTPVDNTGIPIHKFAGNVQTLTNNNLTTPSSDLTQRLDAALGSVHVNDTQGNAASVDVNYRGFTASPALGTPQGLSVFLDGVRMNEPFGDVVSWDAIPLIAIQKVTLIPGSNPVYGLNTLGGAIALTTKSGATFSGSQADVRLGSFGHTSVDAEHGSRSDDGNLYLAASVRNDNGWAANNPGQVRQFFGRYETYIESGDVALSALYSDNLLYGNQTVPLSMLDNAAQGYSHPDYVGARSLVVNAQGYREVDASNAYTANVYLRDIQKDILNSNINDLVTPGNNLASCVSNAPVDCPATILLASYRQQILGANLQWRNTDWLPALNQVLTMGVNAELSNAAFTNAARYATLDTSNGMLPAAPWQSQADIQSSNRRWGLFATSTLDATDKLSITASARLDYASIRLSGLSCIDTDLCDLNTATGLTTSVAGEHAYQRVNPSLGMTYMVSPVASVFANYAEGMRTPSAIELACADPAAPCSGVPNAFGADPDLQPVVSRTIEMGMRGSFGGSGSALKWRAAYYRTTLDNDIIFNQSTLVSGYFSNVGQTLRQGMELGVDGKLGALEYAVDLDRIEATYQSPFTVANQTNSAQSVPVAPGARIPGIPQWLLKTRLSYALSGLTRMGLGLQSQGPTFARGDENNADINGQVAGFTTVKLDVQHSVGKSALVYAGINNLFNARYANYGALATNNITSGANEQFLSLGAPRALYAGVQIRF